MGEGREGGYHPLTATYPLLARARMHSHARVRVCVREVRTRAHNLAAVVSLEQGGRDNKICDNQLQRRRQRRREKRHDASLGRAFMRRPSRYVHIFPSTRSPVFSSYPVLRLYSPHLPSPRLCLLYLLRM